MTLTMDIEELGRILSDFVQTGYSQAVKAYDEPKDMIRRTKIRDWLKYNSYDEKVFRSLVDMGMIKPFRKGEGRNSPMFYSKEEIKRVFAILKVKRVIDGNLMRPHYE